MEDPAIAEPFETGVLPRELEQIKNRRQVLYNGNGRGRPVADEIHRRDAKASKIAPPRPAADSDPSARSQRLAECFGDAHRVRPFGIAISGGGIRSATFSLGILQGLAERNLLKHVDYLSTVSGGGYIGSWLHGLIRNRCEGDPEQASKILSPKENPVPDSPDDDPIAFLRKYSNYPAPKPTLFSADIWVMALIWVRNFLLNQLILVPALGAVILLSLIAGFLYQVANIAIAKDEQSLAGTAVVLVATTLMALGLATVIAVLNLRRIVKQTYDFKSAGERESASSRPLLQKAGPYPENILELSGIIGGLLLVGFCLDIYFETFPWLVIGFAVLALIGAFVRLAPDRWSLLSVPLVFVSALVIGSHGAAETRVGNATCIGIVLLVLFALFQLSGGFVRTYVFLHKDKERFARFIAWLHVAWIAPAAAAVSAALMFTTWRIMDGNGNLWAPWIQLTFAPSLICLSLFSGVSLLLGLMGADYPDGAREWISRVGSMIVLVCIVWIALFVLGVFGPWGFAKLLSSSEALGMTAIGSWLLTTIGGVLLGKSPSSGANPNGSNSKRMLGWLMSIAPTVFMVGYLLLMSFAVHGSFRFALTAGRIPVSDAATTAATSEMVQGRPAAHEATAQAPIHQPSSGPVEKDQKKTGALGKAFEPFARFEKSYPHILAFAQRPEADWTQVFTPFVRPAKAFLDLLPFTTAFGKSLEGKAGAGTGIAPADVSGWEKLGWLLLFFCVCSGWFILASRRININEFSMHHFYKNRLVRCYLGASNSRKRNPNALTGFDPADDFSLSSLVPTHSPAPYFGPYAIMNTALNLNAGSELAQQERKAASFVFTPEFCGFSPPYSKEDHRVVDRHAGRFEPHGYRRTKGYSCPSGPNIGIAMAISGAAANPNSGYQTSGPMAFLLTVFDARLGWWLGNPRWKDSSRNSGPLFALKYLFLELLGQTTGRSKFVNLSDGGHFDNLGLYELVRRRCRYIIVCDGEQDGDLTFGSLGGAIRKCRADFGVEIDINPDPIRSVNGFSKVHCVMGVIEYPEVEQGESAPICSGVEEWRNGKRSGKARGWLLYLKSSLVGDEPADVIEYRSRQPKFPHESTADQFFSESQFESYRRLGLHIIRDALEGVSVGDEAVDLRRIFQDLTRKWYAPIPVTPEAASRLADSYTSLIRSLGENPALEPFIAELLPKTQAAGNGSPVLISKDYLVFGIELIQLMENVYTEFNLHYAANRANPRNAGWMQAFGRWAQSDLFYNEIWRRVEQDYNPLFRDFMRDLRDRCGDDVPMRS